jgi:hypothetical protein
MPQCGQGRPAKRVRRASQLFAENPKSLLPDFADFERFLDESIGKHEDLRQRQAQLRTYTALRQKAVINGGQPCQNPRKSGEKEFAVIRK